MPVLYPPILFPAGSLYLPSMKLQKPKAKLPLQLRVQTGNYWRRARIMKAFHTNVKLPDQAVLGMKGLSLSPPSFMSICIIFLSALFMNCIGVGNFSYFCI
uniref:Uncharacterized protein n=1 Tax=Sphaerodactylus townsendi TaxID=933632 RepID=A0ACB8FUG9_9SAUR